MKCFVLLPASLDVDDWARRFAAGEVPDRSPYGYHHAEALDVELSYSRGTRANPLIRSLDWLSRRVLGFGIFHVLFNWRRLGRSGADVVWTHTEQEFLPYLLLRRLLPARAGAPRHVMAQSVWLADRWPRLPAWQQRLVRALCAQASVCTFLSPENAQWARSQSINAHIEWMRFGVSDESFAPVAPARIQAEPPLRVLSLGNDVHRDWPCLRAAFSDHPDFTLRIASHFAGRETWGANVERAVLPLQALRDWLAWSDVVVIALQPNLHASGLTVLLEAALAGRPVVASDTGGLASYLDADAVTYVSPGDATALRTAVAALAADPQARAAMVQRAQAAVRDQMLTSAGYARRHVELTRQLLAAVTSAPPGGAVAGSQVQHQARAE
jgi:hypothetical protein